MAHWKIARNMLLENYTWEDILTNNRKLLDLSKELFYHDKKYRESVKDGLSERLSTPLELTGFDKQATV